MPDTIDNLQDILNTLLSKYYSGDRVGQVGQDVREAVSRIKALMLECVGEKWDNSNDYSHEDFAYGGGYNQAKNEIRERIEKL